MKRINIKDITIKEIVKSLENNGLVIMPTETVYGAFVDATNPKSVEKLTHYKNRPFGKPYSVAVTDTKMAEQYVELNDTARNLYNSFLPGPVTVVSKGKGKVANGVESETGTLGIRIPDHPLVIDVVRLLGKPITATSANASYQKRPYKVADVLDNLSDKQRALIDLIVDAGELPKNEPSTVIDTTLDDPVILRQGDIKLTDKNEVFSRGEEDTKNIAKELWQKYEGHHGQRAIVFALEGPMGAGKTRFVQGLGKALGIKDEVVSPTYNLEEEYDKGKLLHIDAWRMSEGVELADLEFGKKINDKSIVAIEWADRVADEIRKHNEEAVIIWVNIEYGISENERTISWGIL
jgi:L-threonylcarbamoyladenylate synthase